MFKKGVLSCLKIKILKEVMRWKKDINNLCAFLHEYENEDFDFQTWIKDNGLEQTYEEYIKCT